jgi:ferredoxin
MEFERFEASYDASGKLQQRKIDDVVIPCDTVILAIGQDAAFPWIERDVGIDFGEWDMPIVDKQTFQTTRPGVFIGGDAAWGPENIIWAVEHGHQAAISIHNHCQGIALGERLPYAMNLVSQKMGLHEWSYSNYYDDATRAKMHHVHLDERLASVAVEVELGFELQQALKEAERCLNCDMQTHFTAPLCIECDACIDVCPTDCLTIVEEAPLETLAARLTAPRLNPKQPLYVSEALPQTKRVMVKDEDICVHCGLCAERCPTAAWDMRKFDLLIPYAGRAAGKALPVIQPAAMRLLA